MFFRSHRSHTTWWKLNAPNTRMLKSAGHKRNTRTRAPGTTLHHDSRPAWITVATLRKYLAADSQLDRNFFCSLLVLNRNTLYTGAWPALILFSPPTLVSTHNSDKSIGLHSWIIIDWHDGRRLVKGKFLGNTCAGFYQNFLFPLCTRFSPNFSFVIIPLLNVGLPFITPPHSVLSWSIIKSSLFFWVDKFSLKTTKYEKKCFYGNNPNHFTIAA